MMNAKAIRKAMVLCLALVMGFTGAAMAQGFGGGPQGGGQEGGGNRGDRGGRRGNFNLEEMRARMENFMREQLEMTEDEWEVIGPMVREISEKRREASGMGRMMGRGRFGRRGGPGGMEGQPPEGGPEGGQPPEGGPQARGDNADQQPSAADDLSKLLENKDAAAADIQAKLAALRKERETKEAELKELREKLRKLVTQRQEARLVLMGVLD